MSIEQDLIDLRSKIDRAKSRKAEIEGALKQLLKDLKDKFACIDIKAARRKLEQLQKKKEKLQEELEAGVAELEENFEW